MGRKTPDNEKIARMLDRIADLLEVQEANLFRIRAYRKSAQSVREAEQPVSRLVENHQIDKVKDIPFVGEGLASTIAEYVNTGRVKLLSRLQGKISPEDVFIQVPGIGEELAHRVAESLDIHSLEELEQAAHDGRLGNIEGFGEKRLQSVKMSLAGMLSPSAQRKARRLESGEKKEERPSVGLILDVDEAYRRRAEAGRLKKIAPRRFNPEGKAWLPIWHTDRDGWSFTALYSNTARAHELGMEKDWVVIYFDDDGIEGQCTVVTEKTGILKGRRVVRGREKECRDFYASRQQS